MTRCHREECAPALDDVVKYMVRCTACGLSGFWCTTEEKAIQGWNYEIGNRNAVIKGATCSTSS